MIVLALLIAIATQRSGDELAPPPPRKPIANLRGFASQSTLTFVEDRAAKYRLEASFIFPARVRLWLQSVEGPASDRLAYLQYGEHVFAIDRGHETVSRELAGPERDGTQRLLELRQALFIWPAGLDWHDADGGRIANLTRDDRFFARVERGLPSTLEWLGADGTCHAAFRGIAWTIDGDRRVPTAFTFVHQGTEVWCETVASVDFAVDYIDSHFVPPDRKSASTTQRRATDVEVNLPRCAVRKVAITIGDDWPRALREFDDARERVARASGELHIDATPTFEIDDRGRPTHAVLRLIDGPMRLPAGWTALPDRRAWTRAVALDPAALRTAVQSLRALAPAKARLGQAYVRTSSGPEGLAVQLVQPYEPVD